MASFEKCIFDPVNDLVPNLEVLFVHLLVDVDRFYKLLDVLQFSLRLNTWKVDGHLLVDIHDVHIFPFLLFLNLLTVPVKTSLICDVVGIWLLGSWWSRIR